LRRGSAKFCSARYADQHLGNCQTTRDWAHKGETTAPYKQQNTMKASAVCTRPAHATGQLQFTTMSATQTQNTSEADTCVDTHSMHHFALDKPHLIQALPFKSMSESYTPPPPRWEYQGGLSGPRARQA
jgi:hypothetical protein